MTAIAKIIEKGLDFDFAKKFVEDTCMRAINKGLDVESKSSANPNEKSEKKRLELIVYAKNYTMNNTLNCRNGVTAGICRRDYPWGSLAKAVLCIEFGYTAIESATWKYGNPSQFLQWMSNAAIECSVEAVLSQLPPNASLEDERNAKKVAEEKERKAQETLLTGF